MPRYRISYEIEMEDDDAARREANAVSLDHTANRENVRIEKQTSYFTKLDEPSEGESL